MTEQSEMSFVQAVSEWHRASRFLKAFDKIEEVLRLAASAEATVSEAENTRLRIVGEIERLNAEKAGVDKQAAIARSAVKRELDDLNTRRTTEREKFDREVEGFGEASATAKAEHEKFAADFKTTRDALVAEKRRLEVEIVGLQDSLDELKRRITGT